LEGSDWEGKTSFLSFTFETPPPLCLFNTYEMLKKGPSPTTLAGPILSEVPYPGVLVAKAYSPNSKDLDLVFYPSAEAGKFKIGVERLEPGVKYSVGEKEMVIADTEGKVKFDVKVDGRTAVLLTPVQSK
jgi:hypothetical protein